MKTMKKMTAMFLVSMLLTAMFVVPMHAAAAAPTSGTIIVNGPTEGATYSVYKIFDAEIAWNDDAANGYVYTIASGSEWLSFVKQFDGSGTEPHYFNIDESEDPYVVTATENFDEQADAKVFAKLAYAAVQGKTPVATKKAETNANIQFENLVFGYYLVTSSAGTVSVLHNVNAESVEIHEKNNLPSITKTADKETVSLGDVVTYTTVITAKEGALNYTVHDTMDAALTYNGIVSVTHKPVSNSEAHIINSTYYTVKETNLIDTASTFELTLSKTVCDEFQSGDVITIVYKAIVTSDAAEKCGESLNNSVYLSHGAENELKTASSDVAVCTYGFDIVKTDKFKAIISGAKFKLYDAETGGNEIKVVKTSEGVYRKATGEESGEEIAAGVAKVLGLANGTYYLEETEVPQGYHGIETRQEVTISNANNYATVSGSQYISGGVSVENTSSAALPETGGIGTTVFYIAGAVLVLGAGMLLVSKKRRHSEN